MFSRGEKFDKAQNGIERTAGRGKLIYNIFPPGLRRPSPALSAVFSLFCSCVGGMELPPHLDSHLQDSAKTDCDREKYSGRFFCGRARPLLTTAHASLKRRAGSPPMFVLCEGRAPFLWCSRYPICPTLLDHSTPHFWLFAFCFRESYLCQV